ncbi:MAG: metallophosphoesterase, partial [Pseudomonadota bacterium]
MNTVSLTLGGATLTATASGALYWPGEDMLVVSDLHLGKAERMARRGGGLLPPYDTEETLARLAADLEAWAPTRVICLGDSFDDRAAAVALDARHRLTLTAMMAGRDWVWIAG